MQWGGRAGKDLGLRSCRDLGRGPCSCHASLQSWPHCASTTLRKPQLGGLGLHSSLSYALCSQPPLHTLLLGAMLEGVPVPHVSLLPSCLEFHTQILGLANCSLAFRPGLVGCSSPFLWLFFHTSHLTLWASWRQQSLAGVMGVQQVSLVSSSPSPHTG